MYSDFIEIMVKTLLFIFVPISSDASEQIKNMPKP